MTQIKNILLIGRTGNGKSTLANVISGTNRFRESADSVSETRRIEVAEFEENITQDGSEKVRYRVIDTVGIGDTRLTSRAVLGTIQEAKEYLEQGLSQILFITNGRFTEEERTAYKLLRSVIFDNEVSKYTTIIRTSFPEFENEQACERDRQALKRENGELLDIINSVKIIYVDNPPINSGNARRNAVNKETREVSHEILLTLLGTFTGNYRPENLIRMNERINNYKTEKEKLEEELKEKDKMMKEQEKKLQDKIDNLNKEQDEKMKKIGEDCDKKIKEAKEEADRKIRDAQNQGNLTAKLMEMIEKNRADAEERARKDKKAIEKRAKEDAKEKQDSLRREADLKDKLANAEKQTLENKINKLEEDKKEDDRKFEAKMEDQSKEISRMKNDMNDNYIKRSKGGCNLL